jgi:hypothetical protein
MQKKAGEEVKVVIRTRPTPDFAAKNIGFDQDQSVSTKLKKLTVISTDCHSECSQRCRKGSGQQRH